MQAGMVLRFDPGDDAWEGDIPGCSLERPLWLPCRWAEAGADRAGAVKSPGRRDAGL